MVSVSLAIETRCALSDSHAGILTESLGTYLEDGDLSDTTRVIFLSRQFRVSPLDCAGEVSEDMFQRLVFASGGV